MINSRADRKSIRLAKYQEALSLLEQAHEVLNSVVVLEGEGRDGQYFRAKVAEIISSDNGEAGLMAMVKDLADESYDEE